MIFGSFRKKSSVINIEDAEYSEEYYLEKNPDVRTAVNEGHFRSGYAHFKALGKSEGRYYGVNSSGKPIRGMSDRRKKFFENLKIDGAGLEIGPSHSPIAPKNENFNVKVVDHLSAEGLREKYASHSAVNIECIEDVDYVWSGEPLSQLIKDEKFDWIIASHVLEHVPNPIEFLQELSELLKPGGVISIALPDKRYCFDHFMSVSIVGEWIDAFVSKRIRPTPGQVVNHCFYAAQRNGKISWGVDEVGVLGLVHEPSLAKGQLEYALASDHYTDVHCWRFTAESFMLIINELQYLGYIRLAAVGQPCSMGSEFLISLGVTDDFIEDANRRFSLIENALG